MISTEQPGRMLGTEMNANQRHNLKLSLPEIGLSVRVVNALENTESRPDANGHIRHIYTVEDLLQLTPQDITSIPNLGEKMLEEILNCLAKLGFVQQGRQAPVVSRVDQEKERRMSQLRRRLGYRPL